MFSNPKTHAVMACVAIMAVPSMAFAHPGHGTAFLGGLTHPILGVDHLLAMAASGLLALRAGDRRALVVVPLSFAAFMVVGGLAAALVPITFAEWAVATSVLVLGFVVAAAPRVDSRLAAGLVGCAAFFHGYAHVADVGGAVIPTFAAGFVVSTLALHAGAILVGRRVHSRLGEVSLRLSGGMLALGFGATLLCG